MRNYSFDVLKLFLALLVVFIHIHVPWREVILPLTRCAVLLYDFRLFSV